MNKNAPLNYGLDYFLSENLSLSAYKAYGDEVGLQINFSGSPKNYAGDYLNIVPEPFYSQPLLMGSLMIIYLKICSSPLRKKELELFHIK